MPYTHWTTQQMNTMRAMIERGETWQDISVAVGHPVSSCYTISRKQWPGLKKGTKKNPKALRTKNGNYKAWSEADIAMMRSMRARGVSYERIAARLGRTPGACATKAQLLGLTHPRSANTFGASSVPTWRTRFLQDSRSPASERRSQAQTRRCLNCRGKFRSDGPHNRLCTVCRRESVSPFEIPTKVHL